VVPTRPCGADSTSGLPPACSNSSMPRSSTDWAWQVGWTGRGQHGHHEHARQASGDHVGANPVDRGKPGSKLHLLTEGQGLPLVPALTAANTPDGVLLATVVDEIPPVVTPAGRRRTRPGKLHTDKAYDSKANRA
jgi:hypothetical protein